MPTATPERTYRRIPVRDLDGPELERLSADMKLSLSREDMEAVRAYFTGEGREPTDVELEVIAQTWSEHCKHRIFGALIEHTRDGETETVEGLFETCIRATTDAIRQRKPDFVLSAFHDNAGFVRLDDTLAACLKVETHNHPSAIEPYAGANTGIGGVIRDILGAGKGARPVASVDVFCFGSPDTDPSTIKADDVIHPLGVLRGVVRGVRDYGNRMGIPTVAGAIQFDETYIYNPLVFCGTAGVIPIADIAKSVQPGLQILAVGGRTGRDGLHGATFSSASLTTDSHEEDQQAVQIGNPIEEKKVCDFILEARRKNLVVSVTDCGAGGFSSAAGEMLRETGGEIFLDRAPLKEPGLVSWEIFLSESQERMVLAVKEEDLDALQELAAEFETECAWLGKADDSGILRVHHGGECVCELKCAELHEAPRRHLRSHYATPVWEATPDLSGIDLEEAARDVLGDFAIVSREPIIREYDHEVQGNTVLKPLAGATGDAPQDGAVIAVDNCRRLLAIGLSLLPEWGKTAPRIMGRACIDECVRQLVLVGANPGKLALLDNFCVGNPNDETELGGLVECAQGIAEAALAYEAPFVSGKDSFYNYFETKDGPVSIPVTVLITGFGVVDDAAHVTGSSLRRNGGSLLYLLGENRDALGGSVFARRRGLGNLRVPDVDAETCRKTYAAYHQALKDGHIIAAHDVSEGGLVVALAEMGFSLQAGIHVDGDSLATFPPAVALFGESPGRIVMEVDPSDRAAFEACFESLPLTRIGETVASHRRLVFAGNDSGAAINLELADLKDIWQKGLSPFY